MNSGNKPPPPTTTTTTTPQQQQLHLSPRRELQLQGPRPSPLRVSKDSRKIKKPPLPPPAPPSSQPLATREPVVIYAVSPKVIHVETADFMDLVQRLTGPDSRPAAEHAGGLQSPAAKLAAVHRITQSPGAHLPPNPPVAGVDVLDEFAIRGGARLDRSFPVPGILSPAPSSFPPISPAFFSPPSYSDSGFLSFFQDLSPAGFRISRPSPTSLAGIFPSSPANLPSSSSFPSPGAVPWDLFSQLHDF